MLFYYELKQRAKTSAHIKKMNIFHACIHILCTVGLMGAVGSVSMDVPLKHTVLWEWLDDYMHH